MITLPRQITAALDLYGCPNRCRHCYLGQASPAAMAPDDLRRAVHQFRDYRRPDASAPFFTDIQAMSWMREPDLPASYRALYALERELSDGPPTRFELLSIYRLARDPDYAPWARSLGTRACQISFFGVGATQDWFYRRPGAYDDCIRATETLLAHGIAPRWQLFITKKLLPELDELLGVADRLRLRERTEALGEPFHLFAHLPGPDGEARRIQALRPLEAALAGLPETLLEASRRHLGRERLWASEAYWIEQLRQSRPTTPIAYPFPERLTFYIVPGWDVFTNIATLEPWWRLGNLKTEGVGAILTTLENGAAPGLETIYGIDPLELALRYGHPEGQRVYSSLNDLLSLYVARHCEAVGSV